MAKMHTGPVDPYCAQELAKLTSAIVPLQKLQIQDDTPMEVPKVNWRLDHTPLPKNKSTTCFALKISENNYFILRSIHIIWASGNNRLKTAKNKG